jgi:hypothetical protein
MKTYKLGTFEVMTEDYVINPSYKGRCNVTWDDYEFGLYKSLRDLKEDGWRVPSREEALYLHKLHKEGLLGLQSSINEGKYFIQQKKFLSSRGFMINEAMIINMAFGKSNTIDPHNLASLRLVRSI